MEDFSFQIPKGVNLIMRMESIFLFGGIILSCQRVFIVTTGKQTKLKKEKEYKKDAFYIVNISLSNTCYFVYTLWWIYVKYSSNIALGYWMGRHRFILKYIS